MGKQGGFPNVHACYACLSVRGEVLELTPAQAAAEIRMAWEERRRAPCRGCGH